jgi:acetyl-CoA carboxylase biotin carboxyl carrier protein
MERVAAHITGTVVRIEKRLGESVSAGDVVVVLESMKMEMPVEVQGAGKVKEVRCTEGQAVSEGDLLVVIE